MSQMPPLDSAITAVVDGELLLCTRGGPSFSAEGNYSFPIEPAYGARQWLFEHEEGVTWLRGCVDRDSPAGRALLTVVALRASPAGPTGHTGMIDFAAQLVLSTPLAQQRAGWPFITAISLSGYSHVTKAGIVVKGCFSWHLSWGYSETASLVDEGITWIPGWHDSDSPEVNALKTAFALKEKR